MPPKKEVAAISGVETIAGFEQKETKLLAAAFVASIGPDKYDYDLMATLTGNTAGTLKKMFPPIKRKAVEAHPSFGTFLGQPGTGAEAKAAPAKANGSKKRKSPTSETAENGKANGDDELVPDATKNGNTKKKAAGKGGKKRKSPDAENAEIDNVKGEEDEATEEATNGDAKKKVAVKGGRKRKSPDSENINVKGEEDEATEEATNGDTKKAPAKGRGRAKKAKIVKKEASDDSADGGDGLDNNGDGEVEDEMV
ncbi:hypothetical protein BDV95DRAFT_324069 [Massariosphaeria phaeospora]|uniref:Uncharacterized protein n=1 Tax=Massariosphaeria phaeospora TaxID=100035 RepID=A0A7C8MPP3_9PLEO|nr:hypothetical protein BDV95DRAFT_324069 [Massariosphaeria phaeospora]